MWGKHVEHELEEATRKAKDENQAKQKLQMAIHRIFSDPAEEGAPPERGRFRDPATVINKKR